VRADALAVLAGTPAMSEADVKKALKSYLDEIGAYYYMAVPMGYGKHTLDFLVCHKGHFYGIETKRPGVDKTTLAQSCVMREIASAGGGVILENSVNLEATKRVLLP